MCYYVYTPGGILRSVVLVGLLVKLVRWLVNVLFRTGWQAAGERTIDVTVTLQAPDDGLRPTNAFSG